MKDPKELNMGSSKRRLKGEAIPIHKNTKRTSDNGGIINLQKV